MQIHGGSEHNSANLFLHAGYISSAQREYGIISALRDAFRYDKADQLDPLVINLDEALKIKQSAPVESTNQAVDQTPASILNNNAIYPPVLLSVIFITLSLLSLYMFRKDKGRFPNTKIVKYELVSCLVFALLGVSSITFTILSIQGIVSHPYLPLPSAKWESSSFQKQEYIHPHDATLVLMHGIIMDAVNNTTRPIYTLRDIQKEISLPVSNPTPGQQYALDSYGFDGWGNPFQFEEKPSRYTKGAFSFELKSSGADQEFDTQDDIALRMTPSDDENWDEQLLPYYIYPDEEELNILIHRWPGKLFRFSDQQKALNISNSELYDVYTRIRTNEYKKKEYDFVKAKYHAFVSDMPTTPPVMISWYHTYDQMNNNASE